MYSPAITARFIEEQQKVTPTFRAEYHSIDTVQGMIDLLDEAWDPETKQQTRNLTADELAWIENEHLLCTHDFSYWCNPPDAPIWMADGSYKPLGEVRIGDSVVGWSKPDNSRHPKQFTRDRYTSAIVQSVNRRVAPLVEVTMQSGRRIRCTPDHLWSNGSAARSSSSGKKRPGRNDKYYSYPWIRAKVGAKLRFSSPPLDVDRLLEGRRDLATWLGGIFDGEGSVTPSGVSIAQSKSHNPDVHKAIGHALTVLGFQFREHDKGYTINGGIQAQIRFLLLCRPVRRQRFMPAILKQVHCQPDKVVDIKPVGDSEVVSMQTSTGNYVVWGYLSKNCSRYAFINTWEKKLERFTPNVAQRIVLDIWAEMEDKRWAILMIQLKARQLGVSTLTELAVAHRVQFLTDVDAVVASSTPTKTEKMAKMIRTVWEHTPWWLMPKATGLFNLMPREFGHHNSSLDVSQSGNQFSGVSRGSTPNVFHGSELCEWANPGEDIDASLLNAIHETPWVFVVLESTALGRDNWWHRKWLLSKEGWERGRARLCPIFLPWYVGTDIYPDSGWLAKHPVPDGWQPDESIQHHARRAEEYVQAHPRIKKFLGPHWVMPIEQMWWYDVTRDEYRKASELNRFLSEMPADDFEAFQSTNHSAFDTEVIITLREKTQNPLGVYKLMGVGDHREDIPADKRPMASEVDHNLPIIPIDCRWGRHEAHYQLVPVVFEGYDQRTDGKIFIWEHPRDGFEYGLGIDTGDGIGLDGSVVEGLRKGTLTHNDKQVFEMDSSYINAYQFWPWAYALGSYYSKAVNGSIKQARACIDVQRNGESVQLELRKRGWANFHQWMRLDNKKLRMDRAVKLGFIANQWSRPMMLDQLLTYINNGWLEIESPMFIQEMESFERDDQVQSMKAAFGAHDDRIMALGMILFSFHVLELRGVQASVASQRNQLSAADDPEWDPGYQGRDIPLEFARSRVLEQAQRLGGGPRPRAR